MNKVLKMVLILLMLAVVGLYAYEVIVKGVDPMQNLFRTVIILVSAVISFSKIGRPASRGLTFYEKLYKDKIQDAFLADPKSRKTLIEALKVYNENRLTKALTMLQSLEDACQTPADSRVVGLFTALVYTDMELFQEAANVYENLVSRNLATTTIYSNLGSLYARAGLDQKAREAYEKALFLDPMNPYAYNNMAKLYFDQGDMEAAKKAAMKALEINSKVYQASTLLTIMYAMEKNTKEAEKYAQMAVSAGQSPQDLKEAIAYFTEEKA